MTRDAQLGARVPQAIIDALDARAAEVERETGIPVSRTQVLIGILVKGLGIDLAAPAAPEPPAPKKRSRKAAR